MRPTSFFLFTLKVLFLTPFQTLWIAHFQPAAVLLTIIKIKSFFTKRQASSSLNKKNKTKMKWWLRFTKYHYSYSYFSNIGLVGSNSHK